MSCSSGCGAAGHSDALKPDEPEEETGCKSSCSGGCWKKCNWGCSGSCTNSCEDSCGNSCSGKCSGSCKDQCGNQCTGQDYAIIGTLIIADNTALKADTITSISNAIIYEAKRRKKSPKDVSFSRGDRIDDAKIQIVINNLALSGKTVEKQIEGQTSYTKLIQDLLAETKIIWKQNIDPDTGKNF